LRTRFRTIKNSVFLDAAIENEKTVVLNELRRAQDDPNNRFFYFTVKNIFAGSGYANETLGIEETVKGFTRGQLLDWKNSRLSAQNCVIAISGKICDEQGLLARMNELFDWLPDASVFANSMNAYTPRALHNSRPDKNVRIRIAFEDKIPFGLEYRFKNMCRGRFGWAFEKRLHEVIRDKNGLAYGISTDWFGNEGAAVNIITTSVAPENAGRVVELAAKVAADMMTRVPFSPAELEQRKRRALLGDADWLESQDSRRDKLIEFYLDYGKLYDYYDVKKMAEDITAADVVENARDMFDGEASVITQGAEVSPEKLRQIWVRNFK
jgi:predicted Zn-dependent peptidase